MLHLLTPAEREVAVHLVDGLMNKEIASLLGKSEATVKHQVGSILKAVNCPSRARFMAVYYQQLLGTANHPATRVAYPFFAPSDRGVKKPEQCCVCAAAGSHSPAAVACG